MEIVDEWEHFKIRFTVFYPTDYSAKRSMHILGDLVSLGEDKHAIKMTQKQNAISSDGKIKTQQWLVSKYGTSVVPFEYLLNLKSSDSVFMELPKTVSYKYILSDDKTGTKETEKVTHRTFDICKPETYKGMLSKEGQILTNKCWVVNGVIEKVDGNFIINKF